MRSKQPSECNDVCAFKMKVLLKGFAFAQAFYYKFISCYGIYRDDFNPFISDCRMVRRELEGALTKLMGKHEKR